MIQTGLEIIRKEFPSALKNKRIGLLCHAPSITSDFIHISDFFYTRTDCWLTSIFGPQHGIYGQTQDNMIEWEGHLHPVYGIPVFSLYGEHRKPTKSMLDKIDVLVVDLQDVGARLYTYIWTVKLCMEACTASGIPVWILDRPNPVGRLPFDGPVLKPEYFTFVGGASVPLCHRMTIGELAIWIRANYYPECQLNVVWMKGWKRDSLYNETGLPWVLPSPNMPTYQTALVYPGTVLFEAMNISEGRGTTIPFELFGAPFIDNNKLLKELIRRDIPGCRFRIHDYIPTFHKFAGKLCNGIQIHVTDAGRYYPVGTILEILDSVMSISDEELISFNPPPYEYEARLMPFDILSGDSLMRISLLDRKNVKYEKDRWRYEIEEFKKEFMGFSAYPEQTS